MVEVAQELKELPGDGPADSQLPSGAAPASFAQQRLWFVDRLRPGSPAYHLPGALRLTGRLDAAAAERSLGEIVRRHEALRTVFRAVGGQLLQVVLPDVPCPLPIVDLSHLPPVDREAEAARRAAVEFRRAFDLERGPLLRAGLLRLAAEEHVLWLEVHHIACDGLSMGILFQDFAALYAAFLRGEPSPLPPLPVRHADHAAAQRARMQGDTLHEHLTYWRQQLNGLAESLELPTDRPRPVEPALHGGTRFFSLPMGLTEALESLGRREGTWLFMTLLAGFQALLQRYTGQNDIAVGAPVADRPRRELHKMIGCFLNLVVLRTDLSGDPSFHELLRRVRASALRAYAHQELPFERLVEELRPARVPGLQPLIQVTFTLLDDPTLGMALPGLKVASIAVDCGAAQYDLSLTMTRTEAGLDGALQYDSDLFDAATIDRMIGHFKVLLGAAVADPDCRLSALPLLSEPEKQQLLGEWNATQREYPRQRTVHALFEEWAAATPDAVAVLFEDRKLTYRELNSLANRLAHVLRRRGVRRGMTVGLCLDRSPELIVGLLGILKAGGAYVPLDPLYPDERLAFMLRDTAAPVVLVHGSTAARLTPLLQQAGIQAIDVQQASAGEDDKVTRWQGDKVTKTTDVTLSPCHLVTLSSSEGEATADDVAYVMYTSGSTGRPKGVLVGHRAVVRLVRGTDYCHFGTDEVFLHLAPLSFDASTFEIWGPLLNGGRLALLSPGPPLPEVVGAAIRRHGVTTLWLTAGLFQLMVEQRPHDLGPLRQLLAGGDVLSPPHVRKALAALRDGVVINGYGPTENTTFSCCFPMTKDYPAGDRIPIGRPIANSTAYVLDEALRPVPVGVPGELYVGGDGLAHGYLQNPELTAEKFIPDPFARTPGARLYRTGDLARYRADGNLEFLGRADDQVKIRGFRIEPSEVESVLAQHPSVAQCAVTVQERNGDRHLVAYVAARNGKPLDIADLGAHLKRALPAYMVPARFVALDALPLHPNGKVDRSALPAPVTSAPGGSHPAVHPRDETEAQLTLLWREALGEESVSVAENFFDSGGSSLLAMSLLARVERTFGRKVSFARFFQAPTIEAVAASIREDTLDAPETQVFALRAEGTEPPLIIVDPHPFHRTLVRRLGGDQPVFGLLLPDLSALPERFTVSDIAANLVGALCASGVAGPYCLAGWSAAGIFACEMARQLRSRGKEVLLVTLFDTSTPEYLRSFGGWRKFPVRAWLWFEKVLYHLKKSRGVPFRKAWGYFRQRMTRFTLPAPKGGRATGPHTWQIQYRTVLEHWSEPCETPLVLFRSAALQVGLFREPMLGWGKVARCGLTVHEMPGEHHSMFLEPHVHQLAALWQECAQRVRAAGGGASPGPVP